MSCMGKPIQINQTNLGYAHVNNCQMYICFIFYLYFICFSNAMTNLFEIFKNHPFKLSVGIKKFSIYSLLIFKCESCCAHKSISHEPWDLMDCDKGCKLSMTEQNLCVFWIACYYLIMSLTYSRLERAISPHLLF